MEALRALLALPPEWTDRAGFFRSRNLPPAVLSATTAVPVGDLLMSPAALERVARARGATVCACTPRGGAGSAGLQPNGCVWRCRTGCRRSPSAPSSSRCCAAASLEQDGPWLRLPTHRATLSPQDERVWQQARELIAAERFRPPRTRDLARALSVPEAAMRAMLKRLQRMGRLIEVAPDQFFLSETVAEMAAIAASIADADPAGTLTAAEFRDRLANGRKVAILSPGILRPCRRHRAHRR